MKKVLIKVSGDLFQNPHFLKWLTSFGSEAKLVICVGGGTQIKEEFRRHGWKNDNYGALGRETTDEESKVAEGVLLDNQLRLIEDLSAHEIRADVVVPILKCEGVTCHVNGDQFIRTFYQGFDELWIVTTPERVDRKFREFADLLKVRIKAFA